MSWIAFSLLGLSAVMGGKVILSLFAVEISHVILRVLLGSPLLTLDVTICCSDVSKA